MFAQKLKSRCAVLLRQGEGAKQRKAERLPCSLSIEIQTPRGVMTAPVYEISMDGILISGPDAERLQPRESLARRWRMSAPAGFASASGRKPAPTRSSNGRMPP